MKTATAVKKYTGASLAEVKELKEDTSSEEWAEYGKVACEQMGEEWEE